MRHYLTVRTGEIPREREVYETFKEYSRTMPVQEAGIEALVQEIRAFARYYCAIALSREQNPTLGLAFHDLRELKVYVAYPFMLELYHDYVTGLLSATDFASAVRLVEAYVFRRAVCEIPTNSLNLTFATFGKALKKDRYLESIQAHFLALPSYRRFPGDDEFKHDLCARDVYNFRNSRYLLRRLENFGRKERVLVDEYTIEHILPQNPELSMSWQQALGPDWQQVQQHWLHTIGNLTLTGYNTEYSDRPFVEKRDMTGGFGQSPLKLNAGLGQLAQWDQSTIQERANRLADQALTVWASPQLDAATLNSYRKVKPGSGGKYTIENHPHLLATDIRPLFEAFRKEVLALDPCVTEEFKKLYVAFKAETNFVDVVPQAKRLYLSLNMPFVELSDPRGICRDVSTMGRWGNGDIEVGLRSIDELPYVMGLVRQSFERQMGDGGQT
jgi:predicted transport protein